MRMENDNQWQNRASRSSGYGSNPPNLGSARSDYGNLAYGGRLNEEGMERGWWDRASDEVSSWMGDEGAERRRMMDAASTAASNGKAFMPAGPLIDRRAAPGRATGTACTRAT